VKIHDLSDIRSHYERGEGGRHWFDPSTMRFFRTRLPQTAYTTDDGSRSYFVTSEQFVGSQGAAPRKYSVRCYDWTTRDISTIGEFNVIASRSTATARAKALAAQEAVAL
jgi:hypothetical protein